jgi:hypothetical protein
MLSTICMMRGSSGTSILMGRVHRLQTCGDWGIRFALAPCFRSTRTQNSSQSPRFIVVACVMFEGALVNRDYSPTHFNDAMLNHRFSILMPHTMRMNRISNLQVGSVRATDISSSARSRRLLPRMDVERARPDFSGCIIHQQAQAHRSRGFRERYSTHQPRCNSQPATGDDDQRKSRATGAQNLRGHSPETALASASLR